MKNMLEYLTQSNIKLEYFKQKIINNNEQILSLNKDTEFCQNEIDKYYHILKQYMYIMSKIQTKFKCLACTVPADAPEFYRITSVEIKNDCVIVKYNFMFSDSHILDTVTIPVDIIKNFSVDNYIKYCQKLMEEKYINEENLLYQELEKAQEKINQYLIQKENRKTPDISEEDKHILSLLEY